MKHDSYSQVNEFYPVINIEPQGLCRIKTSVKSYSQVRKQENILNESLFVRKVNAKVNDCENQEKRFLGY